VKAKQDQWTEEVDLIISEQGWTHNFFRNRANFWKEKAVKLGLDFDRCRGGWVLLLPQVRHTRPRGFWRSGRTPRDWGN